MLSETKSPFDLINNIDNDIDFMTMLEPYTQNIEIQDPYVGLTLKVNDVISIDSKIYSKVDGSYLIELNPSIDKRWFIDVFFNDVDIKNKKELISKIESDREYVQSRVSEIQPMVEIVSNQNGIIMGSISQSYSRDLKRKFFDEMDETIYECIITEMNKGGYLGYIGGMQVFIPGSLASHKKIDNYEDMLNQAIPVMIDGYVKERDIFIASNKKYIQSITPKLLEEMDKTKKIEGVITGLSPFGIFITFNNYFSGLLHVSEMSPETNKLFSKGEFSIDDNIEFYIKSYTESKIILSESSYEDTIKKWEELEQNYLGKVITSKPFKKVSTGYLFEIEPKIIGLLYDLEAKKYETNIELGKQYQVKIARMDFESGKIFLNHYE